MNPLLTEAADQTRTAATALEDAQALSAQIHTAASEALTSSERLGQHTSAVATQAHRITALCETVREIANKTDLLAVNTAVEAARGSERSRELTHAAKQMQRLAITAIDVVNEMVQLEDVLRQAAVASVLAAEESTKRARVTVEAAEEALDRHRALVHTTRETAEALEQAITAD